MTTFLAELNPLLMSALGFLIGLVLGHWLTLGRDRRKEFNEIATPIRSWLLDELNKPSPPPEVPGRADFRVGHRVTFIDKNLQHRVGLIVRVNQHNATLDCDGQKWRVAFELLRHLVDV